MITICNQQRTLRGYRKKRRQKKTEMISLLSWLGHGPSGTAKGRARSSPALCCVAQSTCCSHVHPHPPAAPGIFGPSGCPIQSPASPGTQQPPVKSRGQLGSVGCIPHQEPLALLPTTPTGANPPPGQGAGSCLRAKVVTALPALTAADWAAAPALPHLSFLAAAVFPARQQFFTLNPCPADHCLQLSRGCFQARHRI